MVFSIGLHTLFFPYEKTTQTMRTLTQLTNISSLSLSVAYDESVYNTTYPEMPALGRMDFVYER